LTYTIFTALTVKQSKPPLEIGITGARLLATVATQSIAVLSVLIAARWPQPYRLELNFAALAMWLCGGVLYIWTISLIFYRCTFFAFSPTDLSPPRALPASVDSLRMTWRWPTQNQPFRARRHLLQQRQVCRQPRNP
jgi:hypothetical protein